MIRLLALLLLAVPAFAESKPVEFAFEDQFETKQSMKDYRGIVVVLVYGDRKASDECRKLGEQLHVATHPTAKDLTPAKARLAAEADLAVPAGKTAPGTMVQAVACCGKMPGAVKPILRNQLAKASPDVPVWLDYDETMPTHFGITTGQANVLVFDVEGRYRLGVSGTPNAKKVNEILKLVQDLRAEGIK